ncbi:DUF1576 domain-containing protein [Enterococcus hirae]|uniref:DUF1576 domain-containing protein n=1 Tax=Enterococcus hirae TaxID=1354 RepID=UPI0029555319|nr:DUF1576 domain-containing protein [Enterococcus hirae]MDV7771132.1 DUF1576 domain-containing protein [Enterococcus hirae]
MVNKNDVIYIHPIKKKPSQKNKYFYLTFTGLFFLIIGLVSGHPVETIEGLNNILTSPSNLMTDYLAIGGFGSAFINVGVLTLLSVLLCYHHKVYLNGLIFASVLTVTGFSFFGKNLYNSLSIILGVYLYARFVHKPFSQYIMVGLFASALSPVVSYITFGMNLPLGLGILFGNLTGILRLFDFSIEVQSFVSTGYHQELTLVIFLFFSLTTLFGFFINSWKLTGLHDIFQTSGKVTTDFMAISSIGAILLNMGLVGLMLSIYVLLIGGDFNGPIIGAILSSVGFSAFGCHLKNSFPILIGIYLASYLATIHDASQTTMIVAAIFGTALAPISGFYGSIFGILAGFLHIVLVHNVSALHGGLSLYNSGFSTGFVAGFLVPILDSLTVGRKEKDGIGKRIIKKNH